MNTDFRVSVTFFENLKVRKLQRLLGANGVLCLIRLWAYAAAHFPDGNLSASSDDLEIMAGWEGTPGDFYNALINLEFLDVGPGTLAVHDWLEYNGWAAGSESRSQASRLMRYAGVNRAAYDALVIGGATGLSAGEYNKLCSGEMGVDDVLQSR